MIYKSCENPSKHDMTGQEHKSPLRGWLQSPPWTNPPISDPWHVPGMILQKSSYITHHQSIIPHLCWTFHLLILKLVKKERIQENCYLFSLPPVQGIPSLPHLMTCPIRYHVPSWSAVCGCVCVFVAWECRPVRQWPVQRNITLPGWCQPRDPGARFIAMEITYSDLWPGPLDRDPAGNITHTHRQTHTPVPDQLWKITLQLQLLCLCPAWKGLARLCCYVVPLCKNCLSVWPCNKELPGRIKNAKLMETLWHGRLTMGNMMADLWKWEVRVW